MHLHLLTALSLPLLAFATPQGFGPGPNQPFFPGQCQRQPLPFNFPPQGSITAQFPNGVNPGVGPTGCEQVGGQGYVAEINYRSVDYCYPGGFRQTIQSCNFPCCKALAAVDGSAGTCVCGQ